MTGARRVLVLLGTAIAAVLTLALPASASFSATAATRATVTTVAVAAPANVTITGTCDAYTVTARVAWTKSATPGVSGYRITAYLGDGSSQVLGDTAATASSYSGRYDRGYLGYSIRLTVTTLTSYGWTTESPKTGVITC